MEGVVGWDEPVVDSDRRGGESYMANVPAQILKNLKNPSPETTCLTPNNQMVVIRAGFETD